MVMMTGDDGRFLIGRLLGSRHRNRSLSASMHDLAKLVDVSDVSPVGKMGADLVNLGIVGTLEQDAQYSKPMCPINRHSFTLPLADQTLSVARRSMGF